MGPPPSYTTSRDTIRRELALEAAISRLDRIHLLILDDLAYVSKDQARRLLALAEIYDGGSWTAVSLDETSAGRELKKLG